MEKKEIINLRAEPLVVIEAFTEFIEVMKEDEANKAGVALFEDVLALAKVGVQNIVPKPKEEEKK